MNHSISRLAQLACATLFLMLAGTTAAFAGPAPLVEPEFPPPPADPQPITGNDFPWMLTSVVALLSVTAVALIAVLWHRTRTGHHGIVTP